ncbi:MAG: excinuclease ABC subunit UvrA [Candidatus Sumerlaeaceae bacterium]|nr:excinuclease ABC subunit UvrA [Candidatus Sumerlaeaceae bacterium]
MKPKAIEIVGARTHNLKGVTVAIPQGELTVITGVSGSGKSSLAFDTLYAEGQRRYVESLSTYARQFIEKMARPDVDSIRNIQPAIAIEQKNSVKNARSTIGTATEIMDYMRLLFAKAGVTVCPNCFTDVREDSPQSVAAELLAKFPNQRLYIVAPIPRGDAKSETFRTELMRAGFSRIYVAPAEPKSGGKPPRGKAPKAPVSTDSSRPFVDLDGATAADMDIAFGADTVRLLIDRVSASEADRERITTSLAMAFQAGHGTVETWTADASPVCMLFHAGFRCNTCGKEFPRPEPNLFSFNSPLGACSECSGFGRTITIDWDKVFPDRRLSLADEAIATFNTPSYKANYNWIKKNAPPADVPWDKPIEKYTRREWNNLIYGCGKFEGLKSFFDWLEKEKYKVQSRILLARYRGFATCPKCEGTRLVPEAANVLWGPADQSFQRRNIYELTRLSIRDLLADFASVRLTPAEEELSGRVFREILSRLTYLVRVGLGYLTLDRQTRTLSGGEAQRINLATALGTALTRTLYVLDEPTVGLHARDSRRLLEILRDLRDKGNTIVVVEHDPELILGADHLVDMGPRAGSHGGEVVFSGSPDSLAKDGTQSLTAQFLAPRSSSKVEKGVRKKSKEDAKAPKSEVRTQNSELVITAARFHNLKSISVFIPLHKWVCITGVSGSGKSTLVHNIIYQAFNQHKGLAVEDIGQFDKIKGFEHLYEIELIDQSPIGRSIRSNPVTYVKAYDPIRKLFADTREARALGLTEGSFSFNVPGGRCETCEGTGVTTYDMHFLAEMTLPCEDCGGRRFQARVLDVHYRDRNIDNVLGLTVDDACDFFENVPAITRRLKPLQDVGLGYLTLGQNTSTLSGGEAQRLKLASRLATEANGSRVMMIFDEPTTGLHLADLAVLSGVFRRLVERGFSLVIIEHNLEIIRQADWIIDLGPEGGDEGGYVVAVGKPAAIAAEPRSHTGRFLKELL